MMRNDHQTVFVVDDDAAMRDALEVLIRSICLQVEVHSTAESFLSEYQPERSGCLLLDVRMPGMDGPALQDALIERDIKIPLIFLTAHGDMEFAVRATKKGALDCISKPFREQVLIDGVKRALDVDRQQRQDRSERESINQRFLSLTAREREVLQLVVRGKHNKVIGTELGLSHKTIEFHRSKIMCKMKVRGLADLVRVSMAVKSDQDLP